VYSSHLYLLFTLFSFWDDWIREPKHRQGRACLRPEISRTYTFGSEGGASSGQFNQYLSNIELITTPVAWNQMNVNDLAKQQYDPKFEAEVKAAELIHINDIDKYNNQHKDLKITYANAQHYIELANRLGIMTDFKSGVPRTAYKGVVTIRYNQNRLFLVEERPDLLYTNSPPF